MGVRHMHRPGASSSTACHVACPAATPIPRPVVTAECAAAHSSCTWGQSAPCMTSAPHAGSKAVVQQAVRHRTARKCVVARDSSNAYPGGIVFNKEVLELLADDQKIVLETGEIGRQASGAIIATQGDTVIYTTACAGANPAGDGSFVPLTVNYSERFSAAGRTSGGFLKRDGRPRDAEVLISRLVDRPLRPMFRQGWANETQVLQWVMSFDDSVPPEPLAITAASAALLISDIPFEKAVAGVRVAWIDGAPVINPTSAQMSSSQLDLVLAGTRDAVLMIEGYCQLLSEHQMMQAVEAGSNVVSSMCKQMEEWAARIGKPKRLDQLVLLPEGLEDEVHQLVGTQLTELYSQASSKEQRSECEAAANRRVKEALLQASSSYTELQVTAALKKVSSEVMRRVILTQGKRMDGRGLSEVRPITSRAGLLPRTHGSCLFTRGETQALAVTTLGGKGDAQRAENLRSGTTSTTLDDTFYLHYFFPPSSVGEVGRVGGPGRRELGHGELAQRALAPVIPSQEEFPYTVRVESTITESNGSSSMATVCGGCLSMLDAGVPLLRPVAGVAMGLILDKATGQYVVLTDILGTEDALGDMDFKVAGDDKGGLTAFQMDIKVEGITLEIMAKALAAARAGREHVLHEMSKCSPAPKRKLADFAPHVIRLKIEASKKAAVIGTGGRTVRQICEASGANAITVSEEGLMEIAAPSAASAARALDMVQLLTEPLQTGRIFRGARVSSIQAFGVFVEISPAVAGLVHVSELDMSMTADAVSKWKVGDVMDVAVLDASTGKLALSRRAVLLADKNGGGTSTYTEVAAAMKQQPPAAAAAGDVPASSDSESSSRAAGGPGRGARGMKRQRS